MTSLLVPNPDGTFTDDVSGLLSGALSDKSDSGDSIAHENHTEEHEVHGHGVKVASFKFDYVKEPLVLTIFIIVIGIFKLG